MNTDHNNNNEVKRVNEVKYLLKASFKIKFIRRY